jgi:hypothetical protein|tara:strand:+ start:802 stop:1965 length:1164 start_codon:yes stop_codon:yes gene_type:complete
MNGASAQDGSPFFKSLYKDFIKYGTVYGAVDINNSIEEDVSTYFVRTGDGNGLYDIPVVVDNTPNYPFDYRIGFGIRKLARFSYERKPRNFYDGTEEQLAFSAPSSALKGLEYQLHWEKERWRGEMFRNHRFFIKHTGDHHIFKVESREVGKINLAYESAEARLRLPLGEKFSISAGAIYRTHSRAYGYNPIEIWLNETQIINGQEYPVNYWYTLGFEYGYSDHLTTYTDAETGQQMQDWIWRDQDGTIVAYSDIDFRETVFTDLMNRYNREMLEEVPAFGEIAPIVGMDFYHYKRNFWIHAYANYILPYHKYLKGDEVVSYLNRNNWGKGGLIDDNDPEQWADYSFGANLGWKINKNIGVFMEGEYSKMWDSELFQTTLGLNYTFK